MTLKGKLVTEYLDKFPNAAKKTLANKIYKDHPSVFKDAENVRDMIRAYTGSKGASHRKLNYAGKKFFKPLSTQKETFKKLPKGMTTLDNWKIEKVTGDHRILLLGDVHIPYHSKNELGISVDYGLKYEPDIVFLNGDFLDHFSISHWQKDPRKRNFPKELKIALMFFEWLREVFPKARIIFKEGNHEERYQNYMEVKAPEMLGIPDFQFENVFQLSNYGIEYVAEKKPVKFNELFTLHGHEYRFSISNPVNPARGLYLRAKKSCLCNHFHQSSSHSENNIEDKFISTWSIGHLGDPHPKYMPVNKWNHGFAVIETSGQKLFQVHNLKIIDGEVHRV